MPLQFDRIGTRTHQQSMGLLAQSYVLGDEEKRWVLDPPFQRSAVWTLSQKVAWIETLLRGIGTPAIIVNRFPSEHPVYGWSEIVIDGQQRLRATAEFMQDAFRVRGELWSEQSGPFQRNWVMCQAITPVVYCAYATDHECAELYLKLLQAGTAHTEAELGKARSYLTGLGALRTESS